MISYAVPHPKVLFTSMNDKWLNCLSTKTCQNSYIWISVKTAHHFNIALVQHTKLDLIMKTSYE